MSKQEKKVKEPQSEVSNVTVNLTIDPNDPRKFPTVDGASQPVVDINVPIKGVKESA